MSDLIKLVHQAVIARGYREGWSSDQFIVRQLLKSSDELSEATELVQSDYPLSESLGDINQTGARSGAYFKYKKDHLFKCFIPENHRELLKNEAIDVIIPMLTLLGELGGTVEDILAKALSDVERGTNYKEGGE